MCKTLLTSYLQLTASNRLQTCLDLLHVVVVVVVSLIKYASNRLQTCLDLLHVVVVVVVNLTKYVVSDQLCAWTFLKIYVFTLIKLLCCLLREVVSCSLSLF